MGERNWRARLLCSTGPAEGYNTIHTYAAPDPLEALISNARESVLRYQGIAFEAALHSKPLLEEGRRGC